MFLPLTLAAHEARMVPYLHLNQLSGTVLAHDFPVKSPTGEIEVLRNACARMLCDDVGRVLTWCITNDQLGDGVVLGVLVCCAIG
jgi:hypothetical protein